MTETLKQCEVLAIEKGVNQRTHEEISWFHRKMTTLLLGWEWIEK